MQDTARICKEISIATPISSEDKSWFRNCTYGNLAKDGNFYAGSYGWIDDTSAEITEHKTDWEQWFAKQLSSNSNNTTVQNVLWNSNQTDNKLMPKDQSMEYAYYWHIDEQGTIDRVICIYRKKWCPAMSYNPFFKATGMKTQEEIQEAVEEIQQQNGVKFVCIM